MKGSEDKDLKHAIKELIIKECQKDLKPDDLLDDVPIVGSESVLQLDSLDLLQVSMALQHNYGVRLDDSKEARRVMVSINALADYIRPE